MMIERINVDVFRAPVTRPVATSFGVMRDRPAVFVRIEESDGAFGWGEIFANWPSAGAEHRARLLIEDMADLVLGRGVGAPGELWSDLTRQTHVRALQCGEWGPFRQVIAGLDTAAHDLLARRAGVPLAEMLAPGGAAEAVPVYASGLHVSAAQDSIVVARDAGIRAFKVKIGFDAARDMADLRMLCDDLREGERLMADANQAWTLREALRFAEAAGDLGLGWLEEPIGADAPADEWHALAQASAIPLAAGENIVGHADFTSAVKARALAVVQPDVAKWGGVSGCLSVAREALQAGLNYCPHFLGGGIGLAASAHLLAAAGGQGMLELDANDNPLRDAFFTQGPAARGGFAIPAKPGLGIETLPEEIARYRTFSQETAKG